MNYDYQFLWVNVNPAFNPFHRQLFEQLGQNGEVGLWEYRQTADEASSMAIALQLLHEYISNCDRPLHLIGHGMSGSLALRYARQYPQQVASLSLLSVPVQPAIDWHSYYYYHLRSLPYARTCILKLVATSLFPQASSGYIQQVMQRLAKDLCQAPSDHSLWKFELLPQGGVEMPLFLAAAQDDAIVKDTLFTDWLHYLKPEDEIWQHDGGGHFFHQRQAPTLNAQIQAFWHKCLLAKRSPATNVITQLSR